MLMNKRVNIVYYVVWIILVALAYIYAFKHTILGYGLHIALFAFVIVLSPLIIVGPIYNTISFFQNKPRKNKLGFALLVLNYISYFGYLILWGIAVLAMWSV